MTDLEAFLRDGYLKIDQPEARRTADAARSMLWQQIGLPADEPSSWRLPVVWASDLTGGGPFGELARSGRLTGVLDRLCRPGQWLPRGSLGNIPVRFPAQPPGDDRSWHIDLNTPQPDGSWAVTGRPHTLLLLTLLSDVGSLDAPPRIRVGSHRLVAGVLDERPMAATEAGPLVDRVSAGCSVARATGQPGDLYVLHPFTVHAADQHRGSTPRFMAQAPILLTQPLTPSSGSSLARVWDAG